MHLSAHQDSIRVTSERPCEPAAILAYSVTIVAGADRYVQLVIGRPADASDPGRERRQCTRKIRLEPANPVSLAPLHLPEASVPPPSSLGPPAGRPVLGDLASGRSQRDPKLFLPSRDLTVEPAGEGRLEAPSDRRTLGDPRGDQVVAGDL